MLKFFFLFSFFPVFNLTADYADWEFYHRLITLRVIPEAQTQIITDFIMLKFFFLFSFFPVFNLTADYADRADFFALLND